jgi:hypothetical protein
VNGLQRADAAADEYRLEGDTLTMDVFEAALKDVSDYHLTGVYRVLTKIFSSRRIKLVSEKAKAQGLKTLSQILLGLNSKDLTDLLLTFWISQVSSPRNMVSMNLSPSGHRN